MRFFFEYAKVPELAVKKIMINTVPVAIAGSNPSIPIKTGVTIKPPPMPRDEEIIPTPMANSIRSMARIGSFKGLAIVKQLTSHLKVK